MILFITGCINMKKIDFYLKEGQVVRDKTVATLAQKYIDKARNNLITMKILSELNNKKAREYLEIPLGYDSNEWVAITGYYAMYTSALALLAKIGFRSKKPHSHIFSFRRIFCQKEAAKRKRFIINKECALSERRNRKAF